MEKRLASWKDVIVETRDYEYLDENLNIIQQKPFIWVWEMDFDSRDNELLIQIWDKVRTKRIPENLGVLIGLAKLWPNINGMVGQGEEAKLKPSSSQSDVREQILRVNAVKYGFSQLKKFDKNQVVKLLEPLIRQIYDYLEPYENWVEYLDEYWSPEIFVAKGKRDPRSLNGIMGPDRIITYRQYMELVRESEILAKGFIPK